MLKFAVQVIIFESLLPESVKVVKLMVDAQASHVGIVADPENPVGPSDCLVQVFFAQDEKGT